MRRSTPRNDVYAPSPAPAHHRRPSAGRADDADDGHAVVEQRDQRRPDGDAPDEVLGAVDRIQHPLPTLENRGATELFAEHGVTGPMCRQEVAKQLLGGFVGIGDRGQIGFRLDVEVQCAEPVQGQHVGLIGHLECKADVVRDGAHGSSPTMGACWNSLVLLLLVGGIVLLVGPRIMRARRGGGPGGVPGGGSWHGTRHASDHRRERRTRFRRVAERHHHGGHQWPDGPRARGLHPVGHERRHLADDGTTDTRRLLAEESRQVGVRADTRLPSSRPGPPSSTRAR